MKIMKLTQYPSYLLIAGILGLASCRQNIQVVNNIRPLADTVGFAHLDWQMDSVMERIERSTKQYPQTANFHYEGIPRVIISPHDDYSYVGSLYPAALKNIRAKTIIIFGVAHKAKADEA